MGRIGFLSCAGTGIGRVAPDRKCLTVDLTVSPKTAKPKSL